MRVVAAPVDRVGYPRELSVKITRDLDILTGGLVLAGVQLPVPAPRPAGKQGSVVDVLGTRVEVLRGGDERGEHDRQPGSNPGNGPAYSRLGSLVRLGEFLLD